MKRKKRGSAELYVFVIVAVVALGGMILLAPGNGRVSGMLSKPYIYDPETTLRGTIDDHWAGVTSSIIIKQDGAYKNCRWECFAKERRDAFNLTMRTRETIACLDDCALKYGQPPWGYAED